uniref:uncharacterized protein LOC122604733 n=1 Tax=Erigeron canadensis TaxID=72917 RepID=UPI001CB940EC|nr:uncharacterized protein LOC122604733 [Erigeron canadensis]
MAAINCDTMEQILIRLDVDEVIRCKGVSKSWYSLISTPYFADSHLKHNRECNNNNDDKRMIGIGYDFGYLIDNYLFIIGCANGLVCVSPQEFELLVINPCTKQTMKILDPHPNLFLRVTKGGSWFGGSVTIHPTMTTRFISGILCDGALHWLMTSWETQELVIISFNLSREEFTKTLSPPGVHNKDIQTTCYTLGAVEESPCLIQHECVSEPTKIWVLTSDNSGKQSWALSPDNYVINCDAVCFMSDEDHSIFYTPLPGVSVNAIEYMAAPIYVRSLVSPHVNLDSSSKSGSNDTTISVEEEAACKEECS